VQENVIVKLICQLQINFVKKLKYILSRSRGVRTTPLSCVLGDEGMP